MITGADLELFERSLRHATEGHTGEALDAALHELGWRDALALDRQLAVSALFELQGRAGTRSSGLDVVLLDALGVEGEASALVLPLLGGTEPPGRSAGSETDVAGLGTAALPGAATVVVARADGAVVVDGTVLASRPIGGIDPTLGLVQVSGSGVSGRGAPETVPWADAVAAGQLALAHELVGASRAMLELARSHALERIQFGQPIAGFQAVRHRLAEAHVAIEGADAALRAAWDEGGHLAAAVAKAVAGRSARVVARHAQQVLAGIGFTAEHPLHRFVRRALVLDGLLGDARSLTRAMGEELLRARGLPAILPL